MLFSDCDAFVPQSTHSSVAWSDSVGGYPAEPVELFCWAHSLQACSRGRAVSTGE
jgi:hypothetical protein